MAEHTVKKEARELLAEFEERLSALQAEKERLEEHLRFETVQEEDRKRKREAKLENLQREFERLRENHEKLLFNKHLQYALQEHIAQEVMSEEANKEAFAHGAHLRHAYEHMKKHYHEVEAEVIAIERLVEQMKQSNTQALSHQADWHASVQELLTILKETKERIARLRHEHDSVHHFHPVPRHTLGGK